MTDHTAADVAEKEARCECGQLIAKLLTGGIELKCKRCKRIVTIPFASIEGWSPSPSAGSTNEHASATAPSV